MQKLFKLIEGNFGLVLVVFTAFSFFFPQYFLWGENYTSLLLMLALFLGYIKIDFSEVFHLRKNLIKMITFVILNIIILPLIFYSLSFGIDQDIRIGFFLLFAVSGATATPFLASFLKLKILWPTIFVILTSALIPFTVPFLINSLFGISIEISVLEMSLFLFKIIFIPAIIAIFFRKFLPKITQSLFQVSGLIGTINMGVFLGIIIAVNQSFLLENLFHYTTIPLLIGVFLLFIFRFILGFYMPHKDKKERWTNSLMFGTINSGIIIILAAKFFSVQVLLVAILSEIPWVLAQPIFQKLLQKFYKN